MRSALSVVKNGILFLAVCLVMSGSSRSQDNLPDDFDQLIQLKTRTLEQFKQLQQSGPPEQAIDALRQIVNIHRKALTVAVATQKSDDVIGKLQRVFADDTGYLSDQLFARAEYEESAALRQEIEAFYEKHLGKQHNATQVMHWKAITADKLSRATKDQQVAYAIASGAEAQVQQALQNRQPEVAERIYSQLIDAELAVLGEAHPDVAVDLNEYGRVLWMQQKFAEAENAYKRSLAAREATTGRDLQFATTAFNLGRVFQDTKRFDKAEQQYLATAAIEEPALGSTNESFIQTLQQLASLYEQSGDAAKLADIRRRISAADPLATVVSHLPKGTFAAAAVQPNQLAADPTMEMLPYEVIEAAGREELGFNPLDVEAAVAFATLPILEPPFNVGVLLKLKAGAEAQFPWLPDMEPVEGQPYLKENTGGSDALCMVEFEDGVLLFGTEESVRQSLMQPGENTVGSLLKADQGKGQLIAAANLEVIRPILQGALASAPALPPALEGLKSVPSDTDSVQFLLNISQGMQLSLILNAGDEQTASRIAETLSEGLNFGAQMALQEMESSLQGEEPVQVAMRAYAQRMAQGYVDKLQPVVSGTSVVIQADAMQQSMGPVAVALLLPAVQAAREAARRTQDMNNLKQIALAMHIYHDVHNKFPARASYDKAGKPLLSWRVHLLPYLDQQVLYDQFRLDEPWDSEHNIELAQQLPNVYRCQSFEDASKTVYVTLDGKGTFMEGKEPLEFRNMTDGLSNTLMVVEANPGNAVIWTKPEDLPFDEQQPGNGLGAIRPQGFQAAYADGSVRLIPADIDPETLRRLILRNDGQVVGEF